MHKNYLLKFQFIFCLIEILTIKICFLFSVVKAFYLDRLFKNKICTFAKSL